MLDHPVFDVALGLIFFYVVLSLVCSAVQEWISSLIGLRSKNLKKGIERLIGDVYAQKVYDHSLIKNLAKEGQIPSYIAPETLSAVLLEVVAKDDGGASYTARTADEVRTLVDAIDAKHPMKEVLVAFVDTSDDAVNTLKNKLSGWFDEGMARVSGWYTRQIKVWIFCIAAVVTVALNASTIHIADALWKNDALRADIAAQAVAASGQGSVVKLEDDNLKNLKIFPLGWRSDEMDNTAWPKDAKDWFATLLGWLITIAAISLGAPFWFDLLGKVANLKGAGGKAVSAGGGKGS
jgi:hypothetical protein